MPPKESLRDNSPRRRELPRRLRLEASSFCQLRCPSCPTTSRAIDAHVGKGLLRPEDFRRLLDLNPEIRSVELSNYGEAFINPDLVEILRIAFERRVATTLANGANLNSARPEMLEAVVRYGVSRITCSIDGATQDTYSRYRVRGNLDRVLDNIRAINAWKTKLGSASPALKWQFIVFEHNKHEIGAAREMARQLGMQFAAKLSWDEDLAPIDEDDSLARQLEVPSLRRSVVEERTGEPYLGRICHQLWTEPAINWDGKLLGCCRNFWGDFGGNAFTDGLAATLDNEKFTYAKAMMKGEAPPRPDIPCSTCDIYETRRKRGQWVKLAKQS